MTMNILRLVNGRENWNETEGHREGIDVHPLTVFISLPGNGWNKNRG